MEPIFYFFLQPDAVVQNVWTLQIKNRMQSFASEPCLRRFYEVILSPSNNEFYTVMCFTNVPFQDAPFITNHETINEPLSGVFKLYFYTVEGNGDTLSVFNHH